MKTTRCILCDAEFTDQETLGIQACPNCGTKNIPCAIKDDVSIRINTHELHILLVWAENYAVHTDNKHLDDAYFTQLTPTLNKIAARINAQIKNKAPTLTQEIEEVRKAGYDATLFRDGKEEV